LEDEGQRNKLRQKAVQQCHVASEGQAVQPPTAIDVKVIVFRLKIIKLNSPDFLRVLWHFFV
jgi:hypothetical protein